MQRVGILGGSFDPIHYGHLAIAEESRWCLGLSQVYMIPGAQQPLKHHGHTASPQQRLDMVQLACADNPALIPSEIEIHRPPPSYTVDTLRLFRTLLGNTVELWFILGSDALMSLPDWHAAADILTLARLAVVSRPQSQVNLDALDAILPGIAAQVRLIDGPELDISSSLLRHRIAAGQPVRYRLPDTVLDYIFTWRLYQDE